MDKTVLKYLVWNTRAKSAAAMLEVPKNALDVFLYLGANNINGKNPLEDKMQNITDINDLLENSQSTTSVAISALRKKGLIEMYVGRDARTHLCSLTEKGEKYYKIIKKEFI